MIASLAGNFGSGAVTELPALVRRAVEDPKKLRICLDGIFYTPVQTAFLAQGDGDREMMFARGYAALKELKYYQGIRDRSGFCELFPSNDPEHPEWELGEKDGFYDHIYLVGRGYRENTEKRGIQIVTDWLLGEAYRSTSSLLALRYQIRKKRGAYLSRYDEVRWACGEPSPEEVVPEQEIVPHWMSLEGCFGTLNSVTADLDPDFFRAAVLGGICRRAGLREERQYTASERAELVQRILAPLKQELITPVSEQELMDALGLTDDPEGWRKLWDEDTQLRAQQYLQERTETELCAQEIEAMKCRLRERFREMEQQIMMLARKDGPSAFGGLYWGYGISEKGEKVDSLHSALYDMGKEKRLEAAWRQKGIIRDAEKHLEWIDQERQTCNWFGRRLREERWFHAWIREMTQMINARITEAWHPMLFENRILRDELLEPMEKLARQIDAFQDVLKELSKFYEAQYDLLMAEPMQEREFLMPRINLAQIHPATWEWYRQQVSTMVDAADATAFRGGLAWSFEDARCEWMSVPWYLVQEECGKPRLISPDRPVPARELFEQYADDFMAGLPQPELTVKELLRVMEEQGISLEETVKLLVGKLRSRCAELYTLKPLDRFAGELLHVAPGLEEEQIRAICAVADTLGLNVFLAQSDIDHMEGVPSGPENGFWLEAESLGMELGRIEALVRWEEAYEKQIHRFGSRLHGAPPKGRMGKTTGQAGPHT